jgi:hypothetical protein
MILMKRVCTKAGGAVTVDYKIMHGVELMQLQGYDVSYLANGLDDAPDNSFGTQVAGNAFNAFMFQGFIIATTIGSTVFDDEDEADPACDVEEGGGSSQSASSDTSD